MKTLAFDALDERALVQLAQRVGHHARAPLVCFLSGDLGAGKTTFCRAFIQALGFSGAVKSPTYNLLEEYKLATDVLHFDLYRLQDPEELEYLGIRDYLNQPAIWLVEWPDKGEGVIPSPDIRIELLHQGDKRNARLTFLSDSAVSLSEALE